jgi:Protein of unknown function (DUF2845)
MAKILARTLCVAVLWLVAGLGHAQPDAFWCGTHLIREGMQAAEVRQRCGEPDSVDELQEPIMGRRADGALFQVGVKVTEFWHYDRGPRSFPARITVEDGIATEVALLRGN